MTCVELQESLAEIEDGSATEQQAHLRTCPSCSALVEELALIIAAAPALLEAEEPGPRVWNSIEIELRQEGLIRPQRAKQPSAVSLGATASDPDGSVAKVEFFYDAVNKIGEVLSPPYHLIWTNAVAGNHNISAVVTDNLGRAVGSVAVAITVNALPAVTLSAPANGAIFFTPADPSRGSGSIRNGGCPGWPGCEDQSKVGGEGIR